MTLYLPLPWQDAWWKRVQRQRDRLAHALLFTGPKGVGKSHFAEVLTASLLCPNRQPNGFACQQCRYCQLLQAHNHPDRLVITPDESSQTIKIDTIRQLTAFTTLTSHGQQAKIAIINGAEKMNRAACNSLLKTVEEPANNRYIILISAHPSLLPATLRSRCQFMTFPVPDRDVAIKWLNTTPNISVVTRLLDMAQGAPLLALELHNNRVLEQRDELFQQWQRFVCGAVSVIKLSEIWEKKDLAQLLTHLRSWVLDTIRIQLAGDQVQCQNRDLFTTLHTWSKKYACQKLFYYLDEIQTLEKSLLTQANINKRLAIENILIFWQETFKGEATC